MPLAASSRSAVSSTRMKSLPPISRTARLIQICPGTTRPAFSVIWRPTSREPVNAIEPRLRVLDERIADRRAAAGQEVQHAVRHARLVARLEEHRGDAGRVGGGLQHDRVAGDDRGGRHAGQDREREVPRRDHDADAERDVLELVSLAGIRASAAGARPAAPSRGRRTRRSRSPRPCRRRPRRQVLDSSSTIIAENSCLRRRRIAAMRSTSADALAGGRPAPRREGLSWRRRRRGRRPRRSPRGSGR